MNEPSLTPRKVLSKAKSVAQSLLPGAKEDNATESARFLEPIAPAVRPEGHGPRVVLLNDCRDQVNYGARVLVDGLIEILSQSLPTATILPVPSHWLTGTSTGLDAFVDDGKGLRQPKATFPALADHFETVADEWLDGRGGRGAEEYLDRLQGADLVVLNGEGSIYRTNPSATLELFLAWLAKERLGVPSVFVNGMVHLTGVMPVLPAMVRKTFPVLDAVAVREACSLRNVREYVPEVDVQLFPDSAFVCAPVDARPTPAVQEILDQIGDSPYFCFDPGAMPMDHRSSRQSALYQMIRTLQEIVPRAVFVSSAPADQYIKSIAAETGSVYVETITDYREYMALVADARFVASGRYHNPLLAAITGCPSITFASSSHKVHGACEMLDGLVGSPYDGTYLRPQLDAIAQRARTYVERRVELGDLLRELCRRRRAEALRLGRLVAMALAKGAPPPSTLGSEAARR